MKNRLHQAIYPDICKQGNSRTNATNEQRNHSGKNDCNARSTREIILSLHSDGAHISTATYLYEQ